MPPPMCGEELHIQHHCSCWHDSADERDCGAHVVGSVTEQIELIRNASAKGNETCAIELTGFAIDGLLPPSIKSFTELTALDMSANSISGSLPTEIGLLTKLKRLALSNNGMGGTLPTELGLLEQLESLELGDSDEYFGSTGCRRRDETNAVIFGFDRYCPPTEILDRSACTLSNSISGTIPSQIGRLSKLQFLLLNGNSIGGVLPTQLGLLFTDMTAGIISQSGSELARLPCKCG